MVARNCSLDNITLVYYINGCSTAPSQVCKYYRSIEPPGAIYPRRIKFCVVAGRKGVPRLPVTCSDGEVDEYNLEFVTAIYHKASINEHYTVPTIVLLLPRCRHKLNMCEQVNACEMYTFLNEISSQILRQPY